MMATCSSISSAIADPGTDGVKTGVPGARSPFQAAQVSWPQSFAAAGIVGYTPDGTGDRVVNQGNEGTAYQRYCAGKTDTRMGPSGHGNIPRSSAAEAGNEADGSLMMESAFSDDTFLKELLHEVGGMDFEELIPVDNFFPSYVNGLRDPRAQVAYAGKEQGKESKCEGPGVAKCLLQGQQAPVLMRDPISEADAVLWTYANGHLLRPGAPRRELNPPSNPWDTAFSGQPPFVAHSSEGSDGGPDMKRVKAQDGTAVGPSRAAPKECPSSENQLRQSIQRAKLLNKATQKRYRERKKAQEKAKLEGMERQINDLRTELEHLKGVTEEKLLLEERVLQQLKKLGELEEELHLTKHNKQKREDLSDFQVETESSMSEISFCAQTPLATFHSKVAELRSYMQELKIDNPGTADVSVVNKLVEAELDVLNKQVLYVCMTTLEQNFTVDVWSLIEAKMDAQVSNEGAIARQFWLEVARSLKLTAEQQLEIVRVRQVYLSHLEELYLQRQELNKCAVDLMQQEPSVEQMVPTAKQTAQAKELVLVLNHVQANLAAEQRGASQLDWLLFDRISTPLQCAWLILLSYPVHCDSLALINAVAELPTPSAA